MFLRRLFRSPTVGSIADWTTLVQLVSPFLAGSALLTWPASSIEAVMRYGWGAAFFLGLLSMCLVVIIASIGAIAWRIYKPLDSDKTKQSVQEAEDKISLGDSAIDAVLPERMHSLEGQVVLIFDIFENLKQRLASEVLRVDGYTSDISVKLKKIEDLLKPNPSHLTLLGRLGDQGPPPSNVFESLQKDIKRVEGHFEGSRDAIVQMVDSLKDQLKSTNSQVSTRYNILATSLRARDARKIVQEADDIVLSIGDKLIKADDYKSDDEWRSAYSDWYKALDRIDRIAGQWTERHKPFLDITHRDYERAGYAAPAHIVSMNDGNSIRYKNVWIAQQQYANQRENILLYFEQRASELPG